MIQLRQLDSNCSLKDIHEQVKIRYNELLIAYIENDYNEVTELRHKIDSLWELASNKGEINARS